MNEDTFKLIYPSITYKLVVVAKLSDYTLSLIFAESSEIPNICYTERRLKTPILIFKEYIFY